MNWSRRLKNSSTLIDPALYPVDERLEAFHLVDACWVHSHHPNDLTSHQPLQLLRLGALSFRLVKVLDQGFKVDLDQVDDVVGRVGLSGSDHICTVSYRFVQKMFPPDP